MDKSKKKFREKIFISMRLNNYFFPDFSKYSGLGHFYRCLKYSSLIKKGKIYFLYINKFKPNLIKILKKKKN